MGSIEHDLIAIHTSTAAAAASTNCLLIWVRLFKSLTRYRQSQGEKPEYPLTFLNTAHRYIGLPVLLRTSRMRHVVT